MKYLLLSFVLICSLSYLSAQKPTFNYFELKKADEIAFSPARQPFVWDFVRFARGDTTFLAYNYNEKPTKQESIDTNIVSIRLFNHTISKNKCTRQIIWNKAAHSFTKKWSHLNSFQRYEISKIIESNRDFFMGLNANEIIKLLGIPDKVKYLSYNINSSPNANDEISYLLFYIANDDTIKHVVIMYYCG